jgi:hypothetical protein
LDAVSARLGRKIYRHRKDVYRDLSRMFGPRFWIDEDGSRINPREWFSEIFDRGIVPDGWAIEPRPGCYDGCRIARVIAVEVEDTHKLSHRKLAQYAAMWSAFDSTMELDLGLLSVDRYGQSERWFNLGALNYATLVDKIEEMRPEERARKRQEVFQTLGAMFHQEDIFQW